MSTFGENLFYVLKKVVFKNRIQSNRNDYENSFKQKVTLLSIYKWPIGTLEIGIKGIKKKRTIADYWQLLIESRLVYVKWLIVQ